MSEDDFEKIKAELEKINKDPSIVDTGEDDLTKALAEIIQIERKHLYGLDSTSTAKRRKEIKAFIESEFKKSSEVKS